MKTKEEEQMVYCLYDDGQHIQCFDSYDDAVNYTQDLSNGLSRYIDIEKEEYYPTCDCGHLKEEY